MTGDFFNVNAIKDRSGQAGMASSLVSCVSGLPPQVALFQQCLGLDS